MPVVFFNCCQHTMRFRPSSDTENDASPHQTDTVLPALEKEFLAAFRAAQHPSTPCDPPVVSEDGETIPISFPGAYYFKAPEKGEIPDIPEGAFLVVSMVTAQAMKMGKDRIDPANLELWFGVKGLRVVCPFTGPGKNCIRDDKGNIWGTRAWEEA
jgi:hypothetical protein